MPLKLLVLVLMISSLTTNGQETLEPYEETTNSAVPSTTETLIVRRRDVTDPDLNIQDTTVPVDKIPTKRDAVRFKRNPNRELHDYDMSTDIDDKLTTVYASERLYRRQLPLSTKNPDQNLGDDQTTSGSPKVRRDLYEQIQHYKRKNHTPKNRNELVRRKRDVHFEGKGDDIDLTTMDYGAQSSVRRKRYYDTMMREIKNGHTERFPLPVISIGIGDGLTRRRRDVDTVGDVVDQATMDYATKSPIVRRQVDDGVLDEKKSRNIRQMVIPILVEKLRMRRNVTPNDTDDLDVERENSTESLKYRREITEPSFLEEKGATEQAEFTNDIADKGQKAIHDLTDATTGAALDTLKLEFRQDQSDAQELNNALKKLLIKKKKNPRPACIDKSNNLPCTCAIFPRPSGIEEETPLWSKKSSVCNRMGDQICKANCLSFVLKHEQLIAQMICEAYGNLNQTMAFVHTSTNKNKEEFDWSGYLVSNMICCQDKEPIPCPI